MFLRVHARPVLHLCILHNCTFTKILRASFWGYFLSNHTIEMVKIGFFLQRTLLSFFLMKLAFRLLILFVDYMANKNLVKLTPVHFCSDVCVCVVKTHVFAKSK